MEPDQNKDHLANEPAEDATNPTPPQGIPRVVAAFEEEVSDEAATEMLVEATGSDVDPAAHPPVPPPAAPPMTPPTAPPVAPPGSPTGANPVEADPTAVNPVEANPSEANPTGDQPTEALASGYPGAPLAGEATLIEEPAAGAEPAVMVEDDGPIFDSEYQPNRTAPKRQREFPFWAWLAIPVALVLGIILVLVFGPLSRDTASTSAEGQAPQAGVSTAADASGAPSRDPGSKDAPLPLATPAPPGKFRAVGLAVFSGPDDVQLNPGSVVLPDTRLTFRLSYTGAQLKDQVVVKWEVDDREWGSEVVHLNPWTTTQWFTRERPESGWPEGRYRLTVLHDDKEESSIFFEVNPTGQPADPATATFPADSEANGEPQGGAGGGVEGSTTESEFSFSRPSEASSE